MQVMLERRRFKVPKLEEDGQMMNKLGYDTTPDVRFEFMRNQNRYAALYRRHVDLQKACEKRITAYERRERAFSSEIRKHKQKVQQRLSKLLIITTANLNQHYGHDWRENRTPRAQTLSREKTRTNMHTSKEKEVTERISQSVDKSEDEPRLMYLPAPKDSYGYTTDKKDGRDNFISKYDNLRDRDFMSALRRTNPKRQIDGLTLKREITM